MADKKPTDLVKIFVRNDTEELEDEVNEWLENNPEFYIDKMQFFVQEGSCYIKRYVVCDFCLREDFEKEEETNLTEELLKGLIGAVNELTDTVKELTNKKENQYTELCFICRAVRLAKPLIVLDSLLQH